MGQKYYNNSINTDPLAALQQEDARATAQLRQAASSKLALQGISSKAPSGNESTDFTQEDVMMAIKDIYDTSESTMIKYIMLGDVAKLIKDKSEAVTLGTFKAIEFGFPASNLTPEIKSLFKTWGYKEVPGGYEYSFTPPIKWDTHVPVHIKCWTRKYDFFQNPDIGFFGVDEFYIPNPFEDYWKMKGLIK